MAFPLIATSMVAARVTGGFYLFLSDRTRDPHEPDDARSLRKRLRAFSLSPRDDRHFPGTSNPYCFSKVIVSGRFMYETKALAASLCCEERITTAPCRMGG